MGRFQAVLIGRVLRRALDPECRLGSVTGTSYDVISHAQKARARLYTEDAPILQLIIALCTDANHCQGGFEGGFGVEFGSLDDVGVFGGDQGRHAASLVAGVARRHFMAHRLFIDA